MKVLLRGSVETPGAVAPPGALSCVPGVKARFDVDPSSPEGARRAALAHWITARDNMLTWRSIVNRVWHYHFGAGLVDTPNDFGHMGSLPTHPELLDWLAVEFRDSGGSIQETAQADRDERGVSADFERTMRITRKIDSDNRYLWRANRQRLDAESMRDSLLAVSGKLDLTMGGPSAEQFFFKDDHSPVYDYSRFDPDAPGNYRRSVYRFIVRSVPDPLMERFDCPDVSMITAKRTTTITAIQALALMNNPFVLKQAEHLAERVQASGRWTRCPRRSAWRCSATPTPAEDRDAFTQYLSKRRVAESLPAAAQYQRISICGLSMNAKTIFSGIMAAGWAASRWRACCEDGLLADTRPGLHHPAKAKRVVQLFMSGAASQCDTFDYKPQADRAQWREVRSGRQGGTVPEQSRRGDAEPVGMEAARAVRQVGQQPGAASRLLRRRHRVRAFHGREIERARSGHVHAEHAASCCPDSLPWARGYRTGWAA